MEAAGPARLEGDGRGCRRGGRSSDGSGEVKASGVSNVRRPKAYPLWLEI